MVGSTKQPTHSKQNTMIPYQNVYYKRLLEKDT